MSTATASMTTKQVANRLVELTREGKFDDAIKELYAPGVTSHEPMGAPGPVLVEGHEAVLNKTQQFGEGMEEVHSNVISDPIVADNYFAVSMSMDITMKGMGRIHMEEIAVYQVKDGKITRDQFFYTPMPGKN